jgi:hypothetical protein
MAIVNLLGNIRLMGRMYPTVTVAIEQLAVRIALIEWGFLEA